jgi:long-subunit acyl-CoA synthetase (AMP-forming)
MARGLAMGEVGSPTGLRQLVSKVAVTAYALLNVVGDKLVRYIVKAGFGGKLKRIITGGSALAGPLVAFYETAVVGYGVTECAPLLSDRLLDGNIVTAGCLSQPCLVTEVSFFRSRKQGW